MTSKPVHLFAFVLLLPLAGCFQIIEEINMRSDGSGELMLTIDLSENQSQLRQYLEAGQYEGQEIPSRQRMQSMLDDFRKRLSSAPGLYDVVVISDWDRFVFKIRCSFRRVEDLDQALLEMARETAKHSKREFRFRPNFRFKDGVFTRLFDFPIDPNEFDRLPASRRMMLEKARYIVIYRFEQAIADYSNKAFQLSPSGKALMLQASPAEVLRRKLSPANCVVLAR